MRKLFRHKWVIGVAAMILTLAIGAGAWAATGVGSGGNGTGTAIGDCTGDCAGAGGLGTAVRAAMRGGGIMDKVRELPAFEELKDRLQERRGDATKYRGAILDLVREKMSAEDLATLDALLETAEQQREEIKKAHEELRSTMEQIRDLVKEYLPVEETEDGASS